MNDLELDVLVLNPHSRRDVEAFIASPSHALLLLGPTGGGKKSLALAIISQVLGEPRQKIEQNPKLLQIDYLTSKLDSKSSSTSKSISIEQVRQAQAFVRLKSISTAAISRAILVVDAHQMTIEAQNAFLKLLEEPPKGTLIVLTASSRERLLPTILSRAPKIQLIAPLQEDIMQHFQAQGHDLKLTSAIYHMSKGLPGLMSRLLAADKDDDLLSYVEDAKTLLQQPQYERLIYIDQFLKQKRSLSNLLWALQSIGQAGLQQSLQKPNLKLISHWQQLLARTNQAQSSLAAHPQAKLLLTDLVLHL